MALKGEKHHWYGRHLPEETRKKISTALKKINNSPEFRKKKSDCQKGEKGHNWQGGITNTNRVIRYSLEYRLWREAVFKRDNFTCIWCGAKSGNGKAVVLNADHIKPFYLFPELRFSIDNGRTLCVPCHKTTDTYGRPCGKPS